MSTIVYQETLQSSYETQATDPLTLSFRLTDSSSDHGQGQLSSSSNKKGWSAIEALSFTCESREQEPVYIHPLEKRSSSTLSDKSLEMCTESLGSETGACIMDNSVLFPPRYQNSSFETRKIKVDCHEIINKNCKSKFRPLLTTISGSNSIRVRPYREDGRLVIKVVSASPMGSHLRAERSDGWLRLTLIRDWSFDSEEEEQEVEEQAEEKEEKFEEEEREDKKEEDERDTEENIEEKGEKEVDEVKLGYGVKMGRVKLHQWPTRCKQGERGDNKRLINWETFWVAT